ncbi:MAG TPA: hypothetical protein VL306_02715 [Methylomirabilota bacterium]|nr:hypothetical protein [Methylomirabilota bacterium]
MIDSSSLEKNQEFEPTSVESSPETESDLVTGAEMLETPPDGSFVHGLQIFIAWVKNMVGDK